MGYISQIRSLISKYFVKDCKTNHWSQNSQKSCLWKPYDLKASIRSSFSKIGSKNSLLGKILIDCTSSVAHSTSDVIVSTLNVSNYSTSADSNSIQAETSVLPFETVSNTVKHEKTYSFCRKPEFLHVVNNSSIAQLRDIKLIQ